jgi:hypothetical protein
VARLRERFLAQPWKSSLCVLWAWLCLLSPASAEPLRAALRLAAPADRSLLARVRGQTGDLDVAVEPLEAAPLEASFAAQLESARRLAGEQGVRVLMWALRSEGSLELVVADFGLDRVLVRPLAGASSALEVSAQEEAAALVARSALRASLAGSALGRPSEELAPVPVVVEPVVEAPPAPAPTPSAAPSVEPRAWQLELGALSGLDGVTERGHHALTLRASWRWRALELAALGGYGIPVEAERAPASVRLASHRLEASAGWVFTRGAWSLAPSLALGMQLLRLTADARDARFTAQDARRAEVLLGAFVRVHYQARVGLALRLGLDVLPTPPTLGYDTDLSFTRTERPWHAQPHVGLGITL